MGSTGKAPARQRILDAAVKLVRARGARSVTVDAVAKEAGCAKGLVHYHFKTKPGLLEAAAAELAGLRRVAWQAAFKAATPREAIERSWALLTAESDDGMVRAWASMFVAGTALPDRAVKRAIEEFAGALGEAVVGLMSRNDHRATVDHDEIGWLLGAVVNGMGLELASGADRSALEGAYAAAWLGILSLFAPHRTA